MYLLWSLNCQWPAVVWKEGGLEFSLRDLLTLAVWRLLSSNWHFSPRDRNWQWPFSCIIPIPSPKQFMMICFYRMEQKIKDWLWLCCKIEIPFWAIDLLLILESLISSPGRNTLEGLIGLNAASETQAQNIGIATLRRQPLWVSARSWDLVKRWQSNPLRKS